MNDRERQRQRTVSEVTEEISERIAALQAEYYGHGPLKARSYYDEDLVLVRLHEMFTPVERTLLEQGERDAIQHIRRRFQQHMAEEFKSVVEQATGREVLIFLSETNVEADVSIECFFLGGALTDMSSFEQ